MEIILTTTAAVLALAAPSWAQTALDTDGGGNVTMEEAQAVYPDMTAETFATMDTDADGMPNAAEVAAAQASGALPS